MYAATGKRKRSVSFHSAKKHRDETSIMKKSTRENGKLRNKSLLVKDEASESEGESSDNTVESKTFEDADETGSNEEDNEEEDNHNDIKKNDINGKTLSKKARKQLTAQEIQKAIYTSEFFKSNIFKMQIDELIKEITIKDSNIETIKKVLLKLHNIIKDIPKRNEVTLEEAERSFSRDITIPFCDPKPSDPKYLFGYSPPEDVNLVGSFGLKTITRQLEETIVDISISIPKDLFKPKDYLNFRAFHKRSYYLACLAEGIKKGCKKEALEVDINYEYFHDDPLRPIIRVSGIKGKKNELTKSKFSVRIIPSLPNSFFDTKKLMPDKNCVRFQTNQNQNELNEENQGKVIPTPLYNSSLLTDTSYSHYFTFLYMAHKSCPSFRETCKLGRLWLRQRGFDSNVNGGGFGHFEWAVLTASLLQGGGHQGNDILSTGMTSYQLFKGVIQYLKNQDLRKDYLEFSSQPGNRYSRLANSTSEIPILFDKFTKVNILWKMRAWSYDLLKHEAELTLEMLNDDVRDRFDSLFLKKVSIPQLKYDISISLPSVPAKNSKFTAAEKVLYITFDNYIISHIYQMFQRALIPRVKQIVIKPRNQTSLFNLNKTKPYTYSNTSSELDVGFILNPRESEKQITLGPSPDNTSDVLEFKKLWAGKEELRNFKTHGGLRLCVNWDPDVNKSPVLRIIEYLLDKHVKPDISRDIKCFHSSFRKLLPIPNLPKADKEPITSTRYFQLKRSAFEKLIQVIRDLPDLPLRIHAISSASSPSIRYSSPHQPTPFDIKDEDFIVNAIIEFETSSKWPDDLVAVEKTKTAFLLKIAQLMRLHSEYSNVDVGLDTCIPHLDCVSFLQVLTPNGYGFRFKIHTERDDLLYSRAVQNARKISETKYQLANESYIAYKQQYINSVKHTRKIQSLSPVHPFYHPTVRLFKIWLDSHFLLSHFTHEAVELIVLNSFINFAPWDEPSSISAGFLRSLYFISQWNWKEDPLILDTTQPNDNLLNPTSELSLNKNVYQAAVGKFENLRKEDPECNNFPLFIATNSDTSGVLWTSGGNPSAVLAARLTALSRMAIQLILNTSLEDFDENLIQRLFTASTSDFDFIINLNGNKSSRKEDNVQYKNLSLRVQQFHKQVIEEMCNYGDLFYRDIKSKYNATILFSNRQYPSVVPVVPCKEDNGDMICGLWLPRVDQPKNFRVNLAGSTMPVADNEKSNKNKNQVVLNKTAILSEISRKGGDIIKTLNVT